MKKDYIVHSLDAQLLISNGWDTFKKIDSVYSNKSRIYLIAPLVDGEYVFDNLLTLASNRDNSLWQEFDQMKNKWSTLIFSRVNENSGLKDELDKCFLTIKELLNTLWILEETSQVMKDYFISLTSYFVSLILKHLNNAEAILLDIETAINNREFTPGINILYGIMPKPESKVSHLDEGQAEYAASIIAANLDSELVFWNDRSLFCVARRKDIPSAKVIDNLTYAEATELSFFGAPIVHPHYFAPAQNKNIPIRLCYWQDVLNKGTLISSSTTEYSTRYPVKAFSVMRNISIINIEGSGMAGIPGISSRLFTALREEKISVVLISQASSEYSICIAVPEHQMELSKKCISIEI